MDVGEARMFGAGRGSGCCAVWHEAQQHIFLGRIATHMLSYNFFWGKVGNIRLCSDTKVSVATSDLNIYLGELSRMPALLVCLPWVLIL